MINSMDKPVWRFNKRNVTKTCDGWTLEGEYAGRWYSIRRNIEKKESGTYKFTYENCGGYYTELYGDNIGEMEAFFMSDIDRNC
jgi:hypothetical protein